MNFSAFCSILVTFDLVTPEFTLLTIAPFAAIQQKSAYHVKYLRECPGPIVTYFTGLIVVLVGIIIPIFISRSLWQPVKFGRSSQTRTERPLLFASAFNYGLSNHKSAFKLFIGNNPATLCKNLVNFGPTISGLTLLKCAIFCDSRAI